MIEPRFDVLKGNLCKPIDSLLFYGPCFHYRGHHHQLQFFATMVREKITAYNKMTPTRYTELEAEMHRKVSAMNISAAASDEEESKLSDTADGSTAKRRATFVLDSSGTRSTAHRDKFAKHLVEYGKEEQDRLRSPAEKQYAVKRLKSLNDNNEKKK